MEITRTTPGPGPGFRGFTQQVAVLKHDGEGLSDGRVFVWELDDAVSTLNDLIQAARRVVDQSPVVEVAELELDVESWPEHLTCGEADTLAELFRAVGAGNLAERFLVSHALGDNEPEDRHSHLVEAARAAESTERPLSDELLTARYEAACKAAAAAQDLDPITERLTREGIPHQVLQTGGFCMVVEIGLDGTRALGVTASPEHSDGWLVCAYDTEGETDDDVLHDGPADRAVELIHAQIIDRVIARYDEIVRGNTTDTYDAVRAVAFDDDGIYGAHGEIIDTAEAMRVLPPVGHDAHDRMVGALCDAGTAYQAQLRRSIGAGAAGKITEAADIIRQLLETDAQRGGGTVLVDADGIAPYEQLCDALERLYRAAQELGVGDRAEREDDHAGRADKARGALDRLAGPRSPAGLAGVDAGDVAL